MWNPPPSPKPSNQFDPDPAIIPSNPDPVTARRQLNDSSYAFPRYCDGQTCNANSASAALNKWLKQTIGDGYVMHSFRHSIRDRLRAVNCPSEMIDQIGGWSKRSVGEGYGEGYSVDAIRKLLISTLRG